MRHGSFAILICAAWTALHPLAALAQDDAVKKQLDALQKQMDSMQKMLKDMQASQLPGKDVEELKTRLKSLEELQKTVNTINQQTAPRQAPIAYRAEIVGSSPQLYSPLKAGA